MIDMRVVKTISSCMVPDTEGIDRLLDFSSWDSKKMVDGLEFICCHPLDDNEEAWACEKQALALLGFVIIELLDRHLIFSTFS
jgi:hypothetical protein